jgi:N-acetylmuramic acid 6-phosphate etherase
MTPPFRSSDMTDQPQSWAFVKNPTCTTHEAWQKCFLRAPRCIEWERYRYEELGLTAQQIEKIPQIDGRALEKYEIGNEPMPSRMTDPCLAMWVDVKDAPEAYKKASAAFSRSLEMTPALAGIQFFQTNMDIFEHLALKLMLNTLSTGVMARMGRITGNWMTNVAMANKKLIDRSARIVSDVCDISYERAMEEIHFSRALLEAEGRSGSPTQNAIQRLKKQ